MMWQQRASERTEQALNIVTRRNRHHQPSIQRRVYLQRRRGSNAGIGGNSCGSHHAKAPRCARQSVLIHVEIVLVTAKITLQPNGMKRNYKHSDQPARCREKTCFKERSK